jgi:hypothetical protein
MPNSCSQFRHVVMLECLLVFVHAASDAPVATECNLSHRDFKAMCTLVNCTVLMCDNMHAKRCPIVIN